MLNIKVARHSVAVLLARRAATEWRATFRKVARHSVAVLLARRAATEWRATFREE